MTERATIMGKPSRQDRHSSHALVELRRFRYFPFGVHSAVLLDVSLSGFKVEFTSEVVQRPGTAFWLSMPLGPLGIQTPKRLLCRGECRWFDDKKYRVGGVFADLSDSDKRVIGQVIELLKQRGSFTD